MEERDRKVNGCSGAIEYENNLQHCRITMVDDN
jgi:hypothetical protein